MRLGEVIMATSTSFRISDAARTRLASRAARDGTSATALLDQLIVEGIDQLDYPGIIFRGPAHDRRAALAAGPDVWEVIARLIRIALNYAAEHPDDVRRRIEQNRVMTQRSQAATRQREALLA